MCVKGVAVCLKGIDVCLKGVSSSTVIPFVLFIWLTASDFHSQSRKDVRFMVSSHSMWSLTILQILLMH